MKIKELLASGKEFVQKHKVVLTAVAGVAAGTAIYFGVRAGMKELAEMGDLLEAIPNPTNTSE